MARTDLRAAARVTVCYLITLYHKFDQALRLVRRLAGPGRGFAFHIDRAADPAAVARFREQLHDIQPLAFATSLRSTWGSYQAALANIRCLEAALSIGPFERYVLISGQDYPIASWASMTEFFAAAPELEYVEAFPRDVTEPSAAGWSPYYRFRRYHFWLGRRRLTLPLLRKAAPPVPIFHGSEWCALTHAAARCVVEQFQANHGLRRYFSTSFLVDEVCIPTLLMNSPFAQRVAGVNVTHEQWTPTSGPHPKILTRADLEAVLGSGKLFARKFDAGVDESILDRLDAAVGESADRAHRGARRATGSALARLRIPSPSEPRSMPAPRR